jgi:Male sterility protein
MHPYTIPTPHAPCSANYCGTRELLRLAGGMHRLRCIEVASTYFVNNHAPRNEPVPETLERLPLTLPCGTATTHSGLVDCLLSLPPADADAEAAKLMAHLNFESTYAFGKHLVECAVADAVLPPGTARVVIRPSLISSLAGAPYPGFISGVAGAPGWVMGATHAACVCASAL